MRAVDQAVSSVRETALKRRLGLDVSLSVANSKVFNFVVFCRLFVNAALVAAPSVVFFPPFSLSVPFPVSLSREVIRACVVQFGSHLWGMRPPVSDLEVVATWADFDVTMLSASSSGALSRCSRPAPALALTRVSAVAYMFVCIPYLGSWLFLLSRTVLPRRSVDRTHRFRILVRPWTSFPPAKGLPRIGGHGWTSHLSPSTSSLFLNLRSASSPMKVAFVLVRIWRWNLFDALMVVSSICELALLVSF